MNILFVCENYIPHYGGAEVLFKSLAEGFVQRGHSVSLLTHRMKGTVKREAIGGVQVHRVASFFSRYVFTFSAIIKAIHLARKHDLIQTTTFNGAVPAWIAAKLTGKPVVLTVHEIWAGRWKEITGFPWWKSTMHEMLERMIYVLPFDRYVCVSDATKQDLLKLGVSERRVQRIYNGFNYAFWNPANFEEKDTQELREKLGLEGKYVYFSWGRPGPSKGFEYVLRAIPLIRKRKPEAVFLLMLGSKEKYPQKYAELTKLAQEHGLNGSICLLDSVPYAALGAYVKAADCVMVPSISEGFGYTAGEAAAMGKPVVVSNAGALPEIVSGKHVIFESKNVADLAEKACLVAEMKYKDTKSRRFEWKECIEGYLGVYEKVVGKS